MDHTSEGDFPTSDSPAGASASGALFGRGRGHSAGALGIVSRLSEGVPGYRILREIGVGGMGTVFEAEQASPRRVVALKVMNPGSTAPDAVRRFQQEAEILGGLRHPCIAQVYQAGVLEVAEAGAVMRVPYFAMELVPGGSPLTTYAGGRGLGTRARVELLIRVCEAVQHAHDRGVIHRDLKPTNVLVGSDGAPKVIDFGVARAVGAAPLVDSMHTAEGAVIGTLAYMSPEQIEHGSASADARSDVYALGVMLFELLCDKRPVDLTGVGLARAAAMVKASSLTHPSSHNHGIDGELDAVCARARAVDPAERYRSPGELGADLRRWLGGERVQARRVHGLWAAGHGLRRAARAHRWVSLAAVWVAAAAGANWPARPVANPIGAGFERVVGRLPSSSLPAPNLGAERLVGVRGEKDLELAGAALGRDRGELTETGGLRPLFAGCIRRLVHAGVKAIGVDYVLAGETRFDGELVGAINEARAANIDVVLASDNWAPEDGGPPLAPGFRGVVRWGGNTARLGDGLPQMEVAVENPGAEGVPGFSLACAAALQSPGAWVTVRIAPSGEFIDVSRWRASGTVPGARVAAGSPTRVPVSFVRDEGEDDALHGIGAGARTAIVLLSPPGEAEMRHATIDLSEALTMTASELAEAVGGRLVVIGSVPLTADADAADWFELSGGRRMFGAEAHLAGAAMLRQRVGLSIPTWEAQAGFDAAWALAGTVLGVVFTGWRRTLVAGALAVAVCVGTGVVAVSGGLLLNPAVAMLGLLFGLGLGRCLLGGLR